MASFSQNAEHVVWSLPCMIRQCTKSCQAAGNRQPEIRSSFTMQIVFITELEYPEGFFDILALQTCSRSSPVIPREKEFHPGPEMTA